MLRLMEPTALISLPVEPERLNDLLFFYDPILVCAVRPGCKPPACGQIGAWRLMVECPCYGISEPVVCDMHGLRGNLEALAARSFRCCACETTVEVLGVEPA